MAYPENRNQHGNGARGSPSALAEKERRVTDIAAGHGHGEESDGRMSPGAPMSPPPSQASRGFFDIYKPTQGYYTRIWSGIGYGALVIWFGYYLFEKFSVIDAGRYRLPVQVTAFVVTVVALGLLGYWLLALNRRVCDFLIATEGEMKKVSWSSRKEIIGSTKVVIFVLVFMSVLLFVVDLFFMLFFNAIGLLKGTDMIEAIKGIFG